MTHWWFLITGGILTSVGAFLVFRQISLSRRRAARRASRGNKISPFTPVVVSPSGNPRAKEMGIFIGVCLLIIGGVVSFALWVGGF